MDEAFRASDKVLKKAAAEKQVPWTSIFFVSVILFSHTLVYVGNLETASAFKSIGHSTGGWSGVGLELAESLSAELEEVLKDVAHMLTVAIGEIMEVQDMIDMLTGFQSKSIDVVMRSNATQSLLLLEAHGLMHSANVGGVSGMIAKSMTTSVGKMDGTIKDAIKRLLDKMKPALMEVGKFILKFGAKVQDLIQSFSVSLDRVQKAFDQIMASMSGGKANEPLMMHQTFHMFDAMNTGTVTVQGLKDVAEMYNVPALQGQKSQAVVTKYDEDKSGDLNHKEFTNMIHGGDIPSLLSVVLRSFGKSLAQVAGQVGGAKFRAEIAADTCDYLELMTAKNHTKVGWISDHLGNGSLPLPFVSGVLITLALKVDDPNTHKSVPTGPYVVNQMMKLHPKGFAKAFDQASNASFFEGQGYNPDMHASVVKRLTRWSTQKNPYEGISLLQAADASKLLDESTVDGEGAISNEASTMVIDRNLVSTMEEMAYKVAQENMRDHLRQIEEEHRVLEEEFFQTDTVQYMVMHMMGGKRASSRAVAGKASSNPAVAATKSQIPALPETLQFAKWLSWNATHTAKLFNEWSFKYQKTSSNAIDSFATQVQGMVKKIQGFIKMMMKYSTPEGIDHLETTLVEYAEAQMRAMLYVTKKRVHSVMENDELLEISVLSRDKDYDDKDLVGMIDNALKGPLGQVPGIADELAKAKEHKDLSATDLSKEITKLYATLGTTALDSVSTSLDTRVQTSLLYVEVGKGIKALHAEGMGSVDRDLLADIEEDVKTALSQARAGQRAPPSTSGGAASAAGDAAGAAAGAAGDAAGAVAGAAGDTAEAVGEGLAALVEDAVMLLHALTHALPQASKALIFAKKEVSMLSKTLENIFKVFEVKGPEIFNEVDHLYAKIWTYYYILMLTLPLSLLFYAFWAGGFFGGPGARVDAPRERRPNALAKLCGCFEDCCRCCCAAHEWQGYGGAELCFWSVCIFLQFVVLMLFIMAILITLIAAIQFFLASGCAQIYLLGDQSICGNVLAGLRSFLDTIFPGLTDFPGHCVNKNLLMCELIGTKMTSAAEYTVVGSFLAATFTFQMLVESGQLHTRALTRIRFEHEWRQRHPILDKKSDSD